MNHIERNEGADFLMSIHGLLPPLPPRSDLSAVTMRVARRSFDDVTRFDDEFLEAESPSVLSLDKLKRSVISLQIYRERQSKTLVEGLEVSDRWAEKILVSSNVVISCFYELKIEFPGMYNSIIEEIYSDLKKYSYSNSFVGLGNLEEELSRCDITDRVEVLGIGEEGFFLKKAELHVVNCLRNGELPCSDIIKVIAKERRLQMDLSPFMENVFFQVAEEGGDLDVMPSGFILSKPSSRTSNFSLTSLWQRVTGSTPVTAEGSSSSKISPINF